MKVSNEIRNQVNEILTANDLDFTIEKKPMLIGVEGSLIPKSTG
jgi:hypothetical protein